MREISLKATQKQLEGTFFVLVCGALINVLFFSQTRIEHMFMLASFGIILFVALHRQLISFRDFFLVFFFCCLSIVLTITQHGGEGLAINFLNILLAVLVFCNSQICITAFRKIHFLIAVVLSLYALTMDYNGMSLIHIQSFMGDRINRNSLGILVLANFYSWMCFFSTFKKYKALLWIIRAAICGACAYLLNLVGCRAAIGAMAIFIVLEFVKRKPFSYRQLRWLIILVMLMNVIIVPLYIYVSQMNADVMLLGKNLFSGREYVWQSAWGYFLKSPWIGNGAEVAFAGPNKTFNASAHNTLLNIVCTLGILPAISFVYILGRRLVSTRNYPYNRVAQFAFLSSLVLSLFESFYVDSHFFVFYLILLLPVYSDDRKGVFV